MNEPNDQATAGYEIRKTIFGRVTVHYPCPKCGERLESPLSDAGTTDCCPDCGTQFEVPGADAKQSISCNEQEVREKRKQQLATPPTTSPDLTSPPVMRLSSNQVRHEAELSAHEQDRCHGDHHRDDNTALSEYIPNFDPVYWDEELVEALRCIVAVVNQLRDRVASPNASTFEPMSLNLHWDSLDDDVAALLAQVELAIEQLNLAIKVGVPIPSNEFVFRVNESIIDDDLVFFVRRMQEVLNGLRTRQTQSAINSFLKHFDSNANKMRNCVNEASEKRDRIHPSTWAAIIAGTGFVLLLLWTIAFRSGSSQQQAKNVQPQSVVARSTGPDSTKSSAARSSSRRLTQVVVEDLATALDRGHVALEAASGNGASSGPAVDAYLINQRNTEVSLDVSLRQPLFLRNRGRGQNMFVTKVYLQGGGYVSDGFSSFISLQPKRRTRVQFIAYCADFDKDNPSATEELVRDVSPVSLLPLLQSIRNYESSHPDQDITTAAQTAIWLAQGVSIEKVRAKFEVNRDQELLAREFLK